MEKTETYIEHAHCVGCGQAMEGKYFTEWDESECPCCSTDPELRKHIGEYAFKDSINRWWHLACASKTLENAKILRGKPAAPKTPAVPN